MYHFLGFDLTLMGYVTLIMGCAATSLNIGLFIWKVLRRREGRLHAIFIANMAAANCLVGFYLLLLFVTEMVLVQRGLTKGHDHRNLCKMAGVLNFVGHQGAVGTIFIQSIDRVLCMRSRIILKGMAPRYAGNALSCMWVVCFGLGLLTILPLDYFTPSPFVTRSACLISRALFDRSEGWQFSFGIQIALNSAMFLCLVYMLLYAGVKCQLLEVILTRHGQLEKQFLWVTVAVALVILLCWTPALSLGKYYTIIILISKIKSCNGRG